MNTRIRSVIEKLKLVRIAHTAIVALLVAVPGTSQAFHFPWDQGHDTTDWDDPNEPGPPESPLCDECPGTRSPVYISTGHFIWGETDVAIPGRAGLSLSRTFNSNDPRDGMFGRGWSSNVETALLQFAGSEFAPEGMPVDLEGYVLRVANGKRYTFRNDAAGAIQAPPGRFERVEPQAGGSIRLVARDGASRTFNSAGRLTAESTAAGHSLSYMYTAEGRLARMTDPAGRFLEFSYNTGGRVGTLTDNAGRSWSYSYDSSGNLVSITDALGGVRRYEYRSFTPTGDGHSYSQLTRVTDATGVVVIEVTYSNARVASYTEAENRYNYAYNTTARTVTKTDSTGSQWVFSYNADGLVTSDRDPLGNIERYDYDSNGKVIRYADQLGHPWLATFDTLGRLISATNPAGEATTYQYSGDLPFASRIVSPSGRVTQTTYDARANPIAVFDPAQARTEYTWNASGNLQQIRNALGNVTTFTTEASGLPLTIRDALDRTTAISYDSAGLAVAVTNAAGEATRFEYDDIGLPIATLLPSGRRTTYARDLAGRMTVVTDASGQTTSFEYDAFGRLAARVMSDGRRFTFQYRSDNLLSRIVRPDGSAVAFAYDAAKRLVSEQAGSNGVTYTYSARGEILSATNLAGTITRTYDSVGRMQTETANGQTVAYTYNNEGESISVAAVGGTVQLQRDARGLLGGITAPEGQYAFEHDALARRTRISYPNGTQGAYQYDAANQLQQLAYTGVFAETFDHQYAADGLLLQLASGTATWNYAYNQDNQLSSASNGAQSFSYQYDAADNLLGAGRSYDTANRLRRDDTYDYSYDVLGNLTQKTQRSSGARTVYSWDGWNRLIRVERFPDATTPTPLQSTTYGYDALGRRATRSQDGVIERFVYNGLDRIASVDAGAALIQRVTYGPEVDTPLALQSATSTNFLHANYMGSIVAASNSVQLLGRYEYAPYGATVGTPPPLDNAFRYTAREFESDDLYYYRARYYDPTTARFIGEDPIGLAGGLNLYSYVGNEPINSTDPTGEVCPWCVAVGVGALVGAASDLTLQLVETGGKLQCVNWGQVGVSAVVGAGLSGLGPTGWLLGRGGKAAKFGYNKTPGLLNRWNTRFGWSGPKNGSDVLSLRIGKRHHDIPGLRVPSGGNALRDGAVSGAAGGVGTNALNDPCDECAK